MSFALDSPSTEGAFQGVSLTQDFYLSFLVGSLLAADSGKSINMGTFALTRLLPPTNNTGFTSGMIKTLLTTAFFLTGLFSIPV